MRYIGTWILMGVCLLVFQSCGHKTQELKIAGGTAHLEMMEEMASRMMKENPELKISVAGGGSGVGIKQAGEGIIDIGNSGRELKPEEISKYGLVSHRFAIDGIAVVVHPSNPVSGLTLDQIQAIFSGKITRWKEVGGPDLKINLYSRDQESGTRQTFQELVMKKELISEKAQYAASNGQMKTLISQDPGALGYVSAGHLDSSLKALAVNGVTPSMEAIQKGDYPVQRGLFMVTRGEPQGISQVFIQKFLSDEGQKLVKEKHFIPVR